MSTSSAQPAHQLSTITSTNSQPHTSRQQHSYVPTIVPPAHQLTSRHTKVSRARPNRVYHCCPINVLHHAHVTPGACSTFLPPIEGRSAHAHGCLGCSPAPAHRPLPCVQGSTSVHTGARVYTLVPRLAARTAHPARTRGELDRGMLRFALTIYGYYHHKYLLPVGL